MTRPRMPDKKTWRRHRRLKGRPEPPRARYSLLVERIRRKLTR